MFAMHYLDAHSGSLQVLTSIVLIVVTGVYTILTRSMAKAAQQALRPYVYLDLSFNSPAEMIVILGNSGNKVAGRVTAVLQKSNSERVANLIRALPITTGISNLAPGGRIKYSVIVSPGELLPKDAPPANFSFKIAYHDGAKAISDEQIIDIGAYRSALVFEQNASSSQIVGQLREIARKLPERPTVISLSPHKLCPYCGTRLTESATKCHGCYEWLSRPSNRSFRNNIRSTRSRPGISRKR